MRAPGDARALASRAIALAAGSTAACARKLWKAKGRRGDECRAAVAGVARERRALAPRLGPFLRARVTLGGAAALRLSASCARVCALVSVCVCACVCVCVCV